MIQENLNNNDIFAIPVGDYFRHDADKCYMLYAPLKNKFQLVLPSEADKFEYQLASNTPSDFLKQFLDGEYKREDVDVDTFCTLHLLLNEKCNFHCSYCYSAQGRSSAELDMATIEKMLSYFLSSDRKAPEMRTVMFMGGGEPVLSWDLLQKSTMQALKIAEEQGVKVGFSLTTNGSIMTDEMLDFLEKYRFTVQISFEVLPDVQNAQRGSFETVAKNIVRISERGINHYVRSTVTEMNVDRIPEMVRYCQQHFPKVKKLSCQQVVDPQLFTSPEVVENFFDRYFKSFQQGVEIGKSTGLELRSSSSHLLNYSKRERFCYDLVCLTPYGTLTTCPDVSSPNEADYDSAVFGEITESGINFDYKAFERLSSGSIHTIDKCRNCYARWNCGSGCPSSRRVYTPEIFDSICDFYRKMLRHSLINEIAVRYGKQTGGNLFEDIEKKL